MATDYRKCGTCKKMKNCTCQYWGECPAYVPDIEDTEELIKSED